MNAPKPLSTPPLQNSAQRRLDRLAGHACAALYDELALYPKPGLVSFIDTGSHSDMDAHTFMRSIHALRSYFQAIAALGFAGAPFEALQTCGVEAEVRMLKATAGVNTHRGAIFILGMMCAAGAACLAEERPLTPKNIRRALMAHWGADLAAKATQKRTGHGSRLAEQYGLKSAAQEAAQGFPAVFEVGYPALRRARQSEDSDRHARLHAFTTLLAQLQDTNLVHRGGMAGLAFAQNSAQRLLVRKCSGAALETELRILHRQFMDKRLSPGGVADVLAAACWLQRVGT